MLPEQTQDGEAVNLALDMESIQKLKDASKKTKHGLFKDSTYDSTFGAAVQKATKNDLKEKDVSDMLSAQKAFERFGACRCGACNVCLMKLWKFRLILFNFIFCATGLFISYYFIPNLEMANRVWFYTIYFSFLILCISITQLINHYVMKLLVNITKNTWKVFYVKNIKRRIYLTLLSVCWFIGFYFFGKLVSYPYNPNIYRLIICVLLSSLAFLMTHIFIRYIALNSYFDIFKVRTRKLKTFVTMIELMADIKGLLSLPIMNFLIDFPSAEDQEKAKKQHKSKVSFSLLKANEEESEQIADAIQNRIFHPKRRGAMSPTSIFKQSSLGSVAEEEEEKGKMEEVKEEQAPADRKEDESLSAWLEGEKLATNDNENVTKALNALNIMNMKDLEHILMDLYQSTHREEFKETFINKEWMNKLQDDMMKQGMSYSEWTRFRARTYDHFQPKIKILFKEEKKKQKEKQNEKRLKERSEADTEGLEADEDIDEVHEILNLSDDLYSIRLSGSTQSIKLIADDDLNKLTRVLSYRIMLSLNERKQLLFSRKGSNGNMGRKVSAAADMILQRQKSQNDNEDLRQMASLRKGAVQNVFMNEEWLELDEYKDNTQINKQLFIKIFKMQQGNKDLLRSLGEFAWKKFGPQNKNKDANVKHDLDVMYLNGHIFNIFKDLLLLKKTIDSYTIIITNLQRMVDVITPLLLLFVYLYIFNFNLEDTLGLYISIVGVIAFFGQSYFSSVFSSISFVMALNPFLVGDYIMYKEECYLVTEISLISCTFKWLKTGSLYTFQNEQLSKSDEPIVNLSRSELTKTKYRWYVFMKNSVTNDDLNRYKKRCKELISKHKRTKNENWGSIKCRSNDMEGFTKKKVNVQMKYDRYDSDVNSVGFNCCTQAMMELNLHWEPLPITINLNAKYNN